MSRPLVVLLAILSSIVVVSAARADALIDEVYKDFGSVARGTTLTHSFRLNNPTFSNLHVAGIRTSCVCASATVGKAELAPGESTTVAVTVDTRKFAGHRTFTVYVQVDKPFVQELQVLMSANSREDVTITPGQLAMGRVKKGSAPSTSVTIEYHGTSNWQITGIDNENGYLQPETKELSRAPGQAVYQLNVKLREDTPVGAWYADLWLKTNDPATPRIKVPLSVEVEGTLTATPSELAFGRMKPGSQAERKVVIRGAQPFKIMKIEGTDERIQVKGGSESKNVQVLVVTLKAGEHTGDLSKRLQVVTDLKDASTVEFSVQAQINP